MAKRMPGPLPRPGQLVGCWFPTDEDPFAPGDKFRPAFVMATDDRYELDHPRVLLAYGTGQRTSSKPGATALQAHQFELGKGEGGNQLQEETRFNCERQVWLPFTEEWFKPRSGSGALAAFYGRAPESRRPEIREAVAAGCARVAISDSASRAASPVPPARGPAKTPSAHTLSLKKPETSAGDGEPAAP